jgi:hypothetical protein
MTGTCTNPAKPNGTPCEDGNMCTLADSCQTGVCKAGAAKPCPEPTACQDRCDPMTGTCNPPKRDDTRCDDGKRCTPGQDLCKAGVCTGTPRVCTSTNQCQVSPGTCNEMTGSCTFAPKDNGAPCDADQNLCTQGDSCQAGVCTRGMAVDCSAPTTCRLCNKNTGRCDGSPKPTATPCNDGNACTQVDTCNSSGSCVGRMPRSCQACNACDPADGACKPAAGSCNDGNACTTADACRDGHCAGTPMTCDDQKPCTMDACVNGSCVFTPIDMCVAPDAGP